MGSLHIKNGRVIDPAYGRDAVGDVFVLDGKVVEALPPGGASAAEVIDATGLVVCPGFVDLHVHLREPGGGHKETIGTGTRAAAAGGFTTVVCMPNTSPACDTAGTLQFIKDRIARDAIVQVLPTGCLTVGSLGEDLAPLGQLATAGAVAVSDGDRCVQNNDLMRRICQYASMFDLPVLDHCEDYSLASEGVAHEGEVALRLGLAGSPRAAEEMMVARNTVLATHIPVHIHIQHLSSYHSVDILRRARQRGVRLTAEVTPHHFSLTDQKLSGYDSRFKVKPPLRSERDRQALIKGLVDGTIDCIATGHAPHTSYEKDVEFDYAPFGVIGLETALAVCIKTLVEPGHCDLSALLGMLSTRPAQVLSLNKGSLGIGADADICLFDPKAEWTVDARAFQSKATNCPWDGDRLRGRVLTTIVGGTPVYRDGALVPSAQPRVIRGAEA